MARKHITPSRRAYLNARKKADIAAGLCWVCNKPNSNGKQKCDECQTRHLPKNNLCLICNKPAAAQFCSPSCASKGLWVNPSSRQTIVNSIKQLWQDPTYKALRQQISSDKWQDPLYREKMAQARLNQPKVSLIQLALYQILDELGIRCFREYLDKPADPECLIEYWTFDCVIPKGDITILVEVQGDYWHSLPEVVAKDARKAEYVMSLGPKYQLEYIWEHAFDNLETVKNRVISWLK